jgi:hypothetical protein
MGRNWRISAVAAPLYAGLAGAIFVYVCGALLNTLGWTEAALAQISLEAPGWRVDSTHGFIVPVVAAATCGLLLGLIIRRISGYTKWVAVFSFFTCFFVSFFLGLETASLCCGVQISKARVFAHLMLVTPFMWLFPLFTWVVVRVSGMSRPRRESDLISIS